MRFEVWYEVTSNPKPQTCSLRPLLQFSFTHLSLYNPIDTLREHVLVGQDQHRIERFYRNDAGEWIIREPVEGLDSTYSFITLDLELKLKEVEE